MPGAEGSMDSLEFGQLAGSGRLPNQPQCRRGCMASRAIRAGLSMVLAFAVVRVAAASGESALEVPVHPCPSR